MEAEGVAVLSSSDRRTLSQFVHDCGLDLRSGARRL